MFKEEFGNDLFSTEYINKPSCSEQMSSTLSSKYVYKIMEQCVHHT